MSATPKRANFSHADFVQRPAKRTFWDLLTTPFRTVAGYVRYLRFLWWHHAQLTGWLADYQALVRIKRAELADREHELRGANVRISELEKHTAELIDICAQLEAANDRLRDQVYAFEHAERAAKAQDNLVSLALHDATTAAANPPLGLDDDER